MRTGKIARLPKPLRLTVNRLMDDNSPYDAIIAELEKHRAQWPSGITSITKGNLSMWRKGGYKDWLRDQTINDQLHMVCETAAGAPNNTALANLVAQLSLLQLYQRLAAFDPSTIKPESLADPAEHARIINASARAIRSVLAIQKQNDKKSPSPRSASPDDPNPENLEPFSRENLRKFERIIGLPEGTYSNSRTHPDGWYHHVRPDSTSSDQVASTPTPNPNPNPNLPSIPNPATPPAPPAAETQPTETPPPNSREAAPCPPSQPEDRGYSPIELLNYMIYHSNKR
jgi:hypothetical protein